MLIHRYRLLLHSVIMVVPCCFHCHILIFWCVKRKLCNLIMVLWSECWGHRTSSFHIPRDEYETTKTAWPNYLVIWLHKYLKKAIHPAYHRLVRYVTNLCIQHWVEHCAEDGLELHKVGCMWVGTCKRIPINDKTRSKPYRNWRSVHKPLVIP